MTNSEIVILAMVIATVIMIVIGYIQNLIREVSYKKGVKRTKYIEQLVKDDLIPFTLIDVDSEPSRFEQPKDNMGIIIDDKLYNEKNSYFLARDGRVYVIGKKEDFMIALVGKHIGG